MSGQDKKQAQESIEQQKQRKQQAGTKAPESAGYDKKLDGPNRPST
ncbi:hypothetical protein [Paenibacillus nasutitermitis]|uniref:Uncharacterized protein n=1 Tax=Paenibacillus nasutitermitis TaxID=1652958 RepID=A0A916YJW2_9BACL|nr:hypothetical protein [Paenibacillus nasutitermitis]GGD47123.1 hypothetical protein GCM10010911_00850 [Paenibacillus nasutitermitis]